MFSRSQSGGTINRLREEMDQLFESFFGPGAAQQVPGAAYVRGYPAVNIWEDEHNFYAEAELPGMTMQDVEVLVVGSELTIKGMRKEGEQQAYHRRERGVGEFARKIPLPIAIDADRVEARLSQGVLLITLPKTPAAKPRKVEIRAV